MLDQYKKTKTNFKIYCWEKSRRVRDLSFQIKEFL